ncbi:2Fe-2S iron-sulfur cluster-binding protein [Nonomuraea zeae]|nr:2Fe-2S iron-sulfur cluster-binding protein [Nonomuraea zeae]
MRVNGVVESLDVEPWVSLLDALRDRLGLMGPKKGCDQGACGACTVIAGGVRINACLALAVQYAGKEITTIEGIAQDGDLHPLQAAFVRHDGFQCGYCTSGQICSAVAMLAEHAAGMPSAVTGHPRDAAAAAELSDEEIRERMSGNLCRCGAYNGIVDAIKDVAGQEAR